VAPAPPAGIVAPIAPHLASARTAPAYSSGKDAGNCSIKEKQADWMHSHSQQVRYQRSDAGRMSRRRGCILNRLDENRMKSAANEFK